MKLACEALLLFCELCCGIVSQELFWRLLHYYWMSWTCQNSLSRLWLPVFLLILLFSYSGSGRDLLLLLFFFCTQKSQPTPDNSFKDCNNQVMQLSTDHTDGVCIAAAATCQFLKVFYLHQPQALKKSSKNDAVAAPATMACHLLEWLWTSGCVCIHIYSSKCFHNFFFWRIPSVFVTHTTDDVLSCGCVAFFCQGIDKFLSIPIAHLLAEVMQILGRVRFQLLLSCLRSSTPLKCKRPFPLQVCSTAKSHVTEVMLLHEKLQRSSLSVWRFSRFSYLQFFTLQVWFWIENKQGAAVVYSGDFFKDSFVTLKLFCCTLEELPKAM